MSDISRRDALRRLGLAVMATGALDRVAAQEVHHMTAEAQAAAAGPYTPKSFTASEFRTLERLTDLIVPIENGAPGALAAGCAAWIDMISSEVDSYIGFFNGAGVFLAEDDNSGGDRNARLITAPLDPGKYRIWANSAGVTDGTYALTVTQR